LKLLLDSNALIWAYSNQREMSAAAQRAVADAANDRFISVASLWEIAIKISVGKLLLIDDISSAVADLALEPLPIGPTHIRRVQTLPLHHRDPFDRMMIAQAMEEGLTIVTRDRVFAAYGVPVLAA
jgi:PIN domain nuclease of toxin-antitoxin system